ncbi:nuclear transport factor 2 family protein [Aquiflexum gelatinilyticum]|uniref:Nuclear transport factor 2 family protein n=1 Tax=Aquiflexum gelatinilyticum TaxID=2961943 RepID=A0A9X2SXA7_9BACT|nr:nuclear transport factor 2 family protein [Aquiflexum gelatinilyticum]MCR9013517.1 nuclear transport factor 2 family protein [Aquiflexum gelatinilyticum]
MRCFYLLVLLQLFSESASFGQNLQEQKTQEEIYALIDQYSRARDKRDTVLLKSILTGDVDQLVSSGEWRIGIEQAVEGMQRSSTVNEGKRTLTVDKYRLLSFEVGIVDARYEIEGKNGTIRKMWSTFVLVRESGKWKISGIRNMLPTSQ